MNFSTNQVRHFYLLKRENTFVQGSGFSTTPVKAGDYYLRQFSVSTDTLDDKAFEIMYQGKGGLTHSDIIRQKNIRKINVTPATDMARPLCKYQIQFTSLNPAAASDEASRNFYLNFEFPGFASLTPEETFTKTVVFEADSSSANNTATNCVNAITNAFKNEFAEFVKATASGAVVTIEAVKPTRHNATAGLFELSNTDFILSNFTQEVVKNNGITMRLVPPYAVEASSIAAGKWVNLTASNTNVLNNGGIIRDLEIFSMGDRADNYRMKGWPNFVPTDYMITDDDGEYDVLDVHYYYQGEGTNDDKSEKVITLAMAHEDDSEADAGDGSIATLTAIKNAMLGIEEE